MGRHETIEIGSSPYGEKCAQLGELGYEDRARAECAVLRAQLARQAAAAGKDLSGVRLIIKSNSHDFGCYYELVARFEEGDGKASDAAYWLEGNLPERWDAEARAALGLPPEAP